MLMTSSQTASSGCWSLFTPGIESDINLFHAPVLAFVIEVFVSVFHLPSFSHRFFQRAHETKAREELGRAEASATLLAFLLVPVRLWKIASKIYCFYNASKFCALIDDAFTSSKFLPQSQTPVRDGEKGGEENMREMIDPSEYGAVDGWNSQLIDSVV